MIQTIKKPEVLPITIFGNSTNRVEHDSNEWVEVDMPQEATHALLRPGLGHYDSETRIEYGWGQDMDTIKDRPWVITNVNDSYVEAYDPHYDPGEWSMFCREDLIFLRPG